MPSRIATSTVASCLVDDVSLASFAASSGVYRLSWSTFSAAARYALLFLLIVCPIWCWVVVRKRAEAGPPTVVELYDGDAHRPGGAGDDLGRRVDVIGVEIGLLGLSDLANLIPGDLGDLGLVRLGRALAHAGRLEQQLGCGRCLERKREAAVLVDRDLHGDDRAALAFRRRVVRLAELHDVDAVLAECRSHRRRRVGLPSRDLQLDQPSDLLL